eukprot:TRINITY_DN4995_c0_g1_i1.p1 TRINITY_DN4995_c0_g1~~TRINITY_DN4995_c0_g1_i1.p1  ORF type:complete len:544 (+),score=135.05 TRINITY_DN4995_c0_g1_i1:89-1720(+)
MLRRTSKALRLGTRPSGSRDHAWKNCHNMSTQSSSGFKRNLSLPLAALLGGSLALGSLWLYHSNQDNREERERKQKREKEGEADEILFPTVIELKGPMRGKEVPPRRTTMYDDVILTIERRPESSDSIPIAKSAPLFSPPTINETPSSVTSASPSSPTPEIAEPVKEASTEVESASPTNSTTLIIPTPVVVIETRVPEIQPQAQIEPQVASAPAPEVALSPEVYEKFLDLAVEALRKQTQQQMKFIENYLQEQANKEIEERDQLLKAKEAEFQAELQTLDELRKTTSNTLDELRQSLLLHKQALEYEFNNVVKTMTETMEEGMKNEINQEKESILSQLSRETLLLDLQNRLKAVESALLKVPRGEIERYEALTTILLAIKKQSENKTDDKNLKNELAKLPSLVSHNRLLMELVKSMQQISETQEVYSPEQLRKLFEERREVASKVAYVPSDGGLGWTALSALLSSSYWTADNAVNQRLKSAEDRLRFGQLVSSLRELQHIPSDSPVGVCVAPFLSSAYHQLYLEMTFQLLLAEAKAHINHTPL